MITVHVPYDNGRSYDDPELPYDGIMVGYTVGEKYGVHNIVQSKPGIKETLITQAGVKTNA